MCNFSSGYKRFSIYWWKHWLLWNTWKHPFVFAYQRVTRGYADCDVWNLDRFLADIISRSVKTLKEKQCGHPAQLTEEKWNKVLEDIALGFSQVSEGCPDRDEDSKKLFDKGFKLFHKHFSSLWD